MTVSAQLRPLLAAARRTAKHRLALIDALEAWLAAQPVAEAPALEIAAILTADGEPLAVQPGDLASRLAALPPRTLRAGWSGPLPGGPRRHAAVVPLPGAPGGVLLLTASPVAAPAPSAASGQPAEDLRSLLAATLDSAYDAIIATGPDGRITAWNPAAAALFGYSAEEILGRPVALLAPPELAADPLASGGPLAPGGRTSVAVTERIARDGRRLRVALTVTALPGGALHVCKDVTERGELEDRLRQAHKMEAIGQLAGGIAHDFNNLLTVITGYAIRASDDLPADHPAYRSVAQIAEAGRRAAALTRQLLAFSRKQVLLPRVLDLNALLDSLAPMLSRLVRESLVLDLSLAPGLPSIEADPHQMEQVVMNLVINASDAMPSGGILGIATALEHLTSAARLPLDLPPGSYVVLSVSDTGVGIPEQLRARIFEPFFTTKEPGKGTGLGLATVHGVVRQSGGQVAVEARPGGGTTFRVYLPASLKPLPPAPREAERRSLRGSGTILLTEDDPQLREYASAVLGDLGYDVLAAAHPEEARALAEATPGPIDLLITDLVLPRGSGRDLGGWLAGRFPRIRVLYISGYPEHAAHRDGLLSAGAEFLAKPFSPEQLGGKVRDLLAAVRAPRHILLVDDDPSLAGLLGRALEEAGYRVSHARDGAAALALAARQPVDLLIANLEIPGPEGLETIRHFVQAHAGVPIIAISGQPQSLELASRLGAAAVLEKPFPRSELVAAAGVLLTA